MVKFGIGQSVTRKEDDRLIQGKGCYTDDIQLPDMTHAVFLRSPYAHAKITQIDCEDAKSMPGVLLILQYSDLAALDIGHIPCFITIDNVDGSDHYKPPRPLLADGVVRHVGDPVAMIVAETAAQAIDAMEAIQVEYEELPASITMDAALSADATPIWPKLGSNLGFHWQKGDRSATDTAFAKAAKTVTLDLVNNRIIANSLEPRNAVGDYADGRYTLYSGSQGVHQLKNQISNMILKIDSDLLRVVTPEVGGGFGMKIFVYNEQPLVLIAAQKIGRPVKWNGERSRDAFLSDAQGRDHQTRCEMALDGDNRFLGMRVHTKANMGGHYSNFAPFIPTDCGSHMLVGVYDIPAIHVEVQGVFTNTVPVDAYRGAGRPEATYVIERLVDYCAQSLKVDRMTLRHINFHKTFPAPTAMGTIYDSGNFDAVLEKGLKQVGYHDFEERRAKAKARGMLRGLGIAYYIESCGKGAGDSTRIKVQDDGRLQVFVGTQTNGQGHETAFSQIIADQLGVPIHSVDVIMGDSDLIPTGAGTGGSRSIPEVGSALLNTTKTLIDKAKHITGQTLEADVSDITVKDGSFIIAGTDRGLTLGEIAKLAQDPANHAEDEEPGLDVSEFFQSPAATYPNGCHVCEVEICPETGAVGVESYGILDDFGTVLNPLLLAGQVHGGLAQGIGQAMLEHTVFDENGQLLSGSFMDYTMPRAGDFCNFDFQYTEDYPCQSNPLGVKGGGEAGAIAAPPCVISAIVDALRPMGVSHIDMPATQEKIWQTIQAHTMKKSA